MSRFAAILVVSLAALSNLASADSMPLGPGGGPLLCTPEMDKNGDGVCDWKDTLGTGGGIVVVNPSGGSIYPDPTEMPGLITTGDAGGALGLWTKTSWDGRGATYHLLLAETPTSSAHDVGLESVDLDGDGSLDAIVGDPEASTGGAVYVFFGPLDEERPRALGEADAIIWGSEVGAAFGAEIHAVESSRGAVLLQVNSARAGLAWQFSLDNLPEKSSGGELVEVGSWGWE